MVTTTITLTTNKIRSMASQQSDFGTQISANRERNRELTLEQRAAMVAEIYAGRTYR
jgi:hypothetical protein